MGRWSIIRNFGSVENVRDNRGLMKGFEVCGVEGEDWLEVRMNLPKRFGNEDFGGGMAMFSVMGWRVSISWKIEGYCLKLAVSSSL